MSDIVICGGGMVGMSAAMMLARDGHSVTVVEADPAPPPDDAAACWDSWERGGVAQFRQPHNLLPGARRVLDQELPEMVDRLIAAGCCWLDLLEVQPPAITDRAPRPGDERFRVPSGRRPVMEAVFARAAEQTKGVVVRRGVRVTGLLTGPDAIPGVPHAVGVRTDTGEELVADLVVDAMGRRSCLREWLGQLGARLPLTESQDCGFLYYTRNYTGDMPQRRGPVGAAHGSLAILTLAADNGTWSVTLSAASRDTALKELRQPDVFDRVVRAHPLQAHWVDGQPVGGVLPMAGVLDQYSRFVVDGLPVVTGVAPVGDAWASTNPSAGRGVSVGLRHAQLLRDVVREGLEPAGLAMRWDEVTEAEVTPQYRYQLDNDRVRIAQMDALRRGEDPPSFPSETQKFMSAAGKDADVFRAMLETFTCLALPDEVLARPGMRERVEELGIDEPGTLPGPDRQQLLALLG